MEHMRDPLVSDRCLYEKSLVPTIIELLHSVKNNSKFEFAAYFHHLYGKGKSAAISKLKTFLTE